MEDKISPFIEPGTAVMLENGPGQSECGIVVHCWMNPEIGGYDCWVAFFGDEFPIRGEECEKPYVLRYASAVLKPAVKP